MGTSKILLVDHSKTFSPEQSSAAAVVGTAVVGAAVVGAGVVGAGEEARRGGAEPTAAAKSKEGPHHESRNCAKLHTFERLQRKDDLPRTQQRYGQGESC